MSSTSSVPPRRTGTTAIGDEDRRRRPWWLLVLLAALVILALILMLSRCGGTSSGSKKTSSAAATSTSAGTTTPATTEPSTTVTTTVPATTTRAAVTTGNGTITAAGTTLLPLTLAAHPGTALSRYAGKTVTANSVVVQSAPATNGFWIGPSKAERLWVQLLQPGLVHPHPVRKGDHVSFTGAMVSTSAGFAHDEGVTAGEGAAQLTGQQAHIQIKKSAITFH